MVFIRKSIRKNIGLDMHSFFGNIPVAPNGYEWYWDEDGLPPAEDWEDESVQMGLILRAVDYDKMMALHRQTDNGILLRGGDFSKCTADVSIKEVEYDPFVVEPALFRILSELPLDSGAILKFANQYGDIAWPEDVVEEGGASLFQWHDGIVRMMDLVYDADKMASGNKPSKTAKEKAVEACDFINCYLGERTFLSASVVDGVVVLRTMAADLMAAMMIQLALSIIEQKQYRSCNFCGKPFELTPQVNRSDRLFCTDNCRVKAYQRRKRQVIDLHIEGQKLRQIVDATGADMKTVKKWIDSFKAKEK